jgi:uncharacterized protein
MIIDCHYHLDETMLKAEDLISKMNEAGVDKIALMALVCEPLPEIPPILTKLIQFLLYNKPLRGIGKIFSANFTKDGSINILNKPYKIYSEFDNASVFNMIKRYPDRFYGWIFVNPAGNTDPVKEIDKWAKTRGAVGIKAHPFWNRYAPVKLVPAAECAVRMNKPMLIHAGFNEHGNFMELINMVPELKLILAHAAFPCYSDSWKLIRERKNVYVDLSATAYVGEKITRDVVDYLGADRCLFGTDGPYGFHGVDGKYDYGYIKKRLGRIFPEEKTRRLILGENFAKIAGI